MELSRNALRRVALYVPAVALTAGLGWAGWIRKASADGETLVSCADAEMRMGLFETALEKTTEALRREPNHLHALLIEAHCQDRLGVRAASTDRYRQALSLVSDPDLAAEIRMTLAVHALERHDRQEALDEIALAKPADPKVAERLAALASAVREPLKSAPAGGR